MFVIQLSRWIFNLSVISATFYDLNSKQDRGFTLIEVMIVVVILGISASIVVPKIMGRPIEARATRTLQHKRAIGAALDLYRLHNFNYPTTEQGLETIKSSTHQFFSDLISKVACLNF